MSNIAFVLAGAHPSRRPVFAAVATGHARNERGGIPTLLAPAPPAAAIARDAAVEEEEVHANRLQIPTTVAVKPPILDMFSSQALIQAPIHCHLLHVVGGALSPGALQALRQLHLSCWRLTASERAAVRL